MISAADFSAKGEIEELVRLSYQALERNLEGRSKTLINEKGWRESIDAMNRRVPRMRSNEPGAAPHYPPPRPGYSNQNITVYESSSRRRPYTEYEDIPRDESIAGYANPPDLPTRENPSAGRRAKPIIIPPPVKSGRPKQDKTKTTQSEVRFTVPFAQLVSGTSDAPKETQTRSTKPIVPTTKIDHELQSVRQRLERAIKRKEEAEEDKDFAKVYDLTNYVIPDLERELETILKQQRSEQEKSPAPTSQEEKDKRSHQTKVEMETESEDSDDALYE